MSNRNTTTKWQTLNILFNVYQYFSIPQKARYSGINKYWLEAGANNVYSLTNHESLDLHTHWGYKTVNNGVYLWVLKNIDKLHQFTTLDLGDFIFLHDKRTQRFITEIFPKLKRVTKLYLYIPNARETSQTGNCIKCIARILPQIEELELYRSNLNVIEDIFTPNRVISLLTKVTMNTDMLKYLLKLYKNQNNNIKFSELHTFIVRYDGVIPDTFNTTLFTLFQKSCPKITTFTVDMGSESNTGLQKINLFTEWPLLTKLTLINSSIEQFIYPVADTLEKFIWRNRYYQLPDLNAIIPNKQTKIYFSWKNNLMISLSKDILNTDGYRLYYNCNILNDFQQDEPLDIDVIYRTKFHKFSITCRYKTLFKNIIKLANYGLTTNILNITDIEDNTLEGDSESFHSLFNIKRNPRITTKVIQCTDKQKRYLDQFDFGNVILHVIYKDDIDNESAYILHELDNNNDDDIKHNMVIIPVSAKQHLIEYIDDSMIGLDDEYNNTVIKNNNSGLETQYNRNTIVNFGKIINELRISTDLDTFKAILDDNDNKVITIWWKLLAAYYKTLHIQDPELYKQLMHCILHLNLGIKETYVFKEQLYQLIISNQFSVLYLWLLFFNTK
jgi:hypothetical protein